MRQQQALTVFGSLIEYDSGGGAEPLLDTAPAAAYTGINFISVYSTHTLYM
jgi:hypothetical protein